MVARLRIRPARQPANIATARQSRIAASKGFIGSEL
jgi:hypothetical protein